MVKQISDFGEENQKVTKTRLGFIGVTGFIGFIGRKGLGFLEIEIDL